MPTDREIAHSLGRTVTAYTSETTASDARWNVLRAGVYKIPEDFGAVAGDVGDQSTALQAWLDYCVTYRMPAVIYGARRYRYSTPLKAGRGVTADSLHLHGVTAGYVGYQDAAVLHYTGKTGIALALQGLWHSEISNITVQCDNTNTCITAATAHRPEVSSYIGVGFDASRWHPHAAIAIDPYSGPVPPGGGYAGQTYGQANSSGVTLRSVVVEGGVTGFFNYGGEALASSIRYENCVGSSCVYPYVTCQTQARLNVFSNCTSNYFHTFIDGATFGAQNGSAPTINGVEASVGYRFCNIRATFDIFKARDVYLESVPTLGVVGGALPAHFDCCYFGFGFHDGIPYYPLVHAYLDCPTKFTTCFFSTYEPVWNVVGASTLNYHTYENCTFSSSSRKTDEYKISFHRRGGYQRSEVRGCRISSPDNNGWITYNTNADLFSTTGYKVPVAQNTRSIRYGAQADVFVRAAWPEGGPQIAASGFVWNGATLTFTASDLIVGDILCWRLKPNMPNFPRSHVDFTSDLAPALRVTDVVVGTTVTALTLGDVSELDLSYLPLDVTVAPNDWVPMSTINMDTVLGSTRATVGASHQFKAGDWVMAAAGLALNTRVVAKAGDILTLSKPAIATGTQSIYCSRLS